MLQKLNKGQVIEDSVLSKQMGKEVPLIVYLPFNYSPLYTYPVLYVQDGSDYFSLGKLATTLDTLISNKELQKCIAVGVPVENTRERLLLYHPRGSKHEAYKRFFAEELTTHMDRHYSTNTMSGARAIMGDSLGGTVSLEIALAYPYTFHYCLSQSGAFYENTIERVKAFTYPPELLAIYQVIGLQETAVDTSKGKLNLLELNRQLKEQVEQKGIPLEYREFEGDHTWGYWQQDLPHALRYAFGLV